MKKSLYVLVTLLLITFFLFSAAYAEETYEPDTSGFHFPSGLQVVEDEAFSGTAAEEIVFPDGFIYLGENAFEGNSELTDVYIPPSTQYIADTAFPMNSALIIHGVEDSYAQEWAEENNVPFVVENIWKPILKTVSIQKIGIAFLFQIVIPKKIIKIGSRAEDESIRPQDRPEMYPIDYSFP